MDRVEAKWILLRKLVKYQQNSYAELRTMVDSENHFEINGQSGTCYQVEVQVFWDSQPEGEIRILGSIDDGGWYAWCPISYGTLIAPSKHGP